MRLLPIKMVATVVKGQTDYVAPKELSDHIKSLKIKDKEVEFDLVIVLKKNPRTDKEMEIRIK